MQYRSKTVFSEFRPRKYLLFSKAVIVYRKWH